MVMQSLRGEARQDLKEWQSLAVIRWEGDKVWRKKGTIDIPKGHEPSVPWVQVLITYVGTYAIHLIAKATCVWSWREGMEPALTSRKGTATANEK